ncbi:peptidoglycan DD-metalloendopeptidase family protein [Lactococcus lactis subsp. lactis]|uniref:phage tail spike protein n=1 Tax=Lactococcus lactis TaxID=1358 RepID=UPI001BA93D9E|nr:phage tail spike protein [Lactococcus lactis]MBR8674086.1 peptidoglycan DD-metalloendopeptidase family protein [Lactococcus lactis subsp. lactis]MBR8676955.1 peptidoglycan DD-metalloendopeptidase family protein [Lactococcus lactis subsp. lactis]MBR8684258.1 peptidoglycan DD-metalloendopeptidase family protein [Lactococcus lactis subsp. lactis]
MKPILYEPKATDFENNGGIATLADCRSLKVTEEANGSYIAELTFPITTKYSEYLEDVNYQIKCKPNDLDKYHVFYIYTHYKDMATGLLYVTAKSRTMKLGNRTVKNVVIDNQTGIEAMALLHDGMDLESDIKMFSDITAISSTHFEVSNPLECIKGIDGSLNQCYGGEIKHEPNRISLLKRRGKDNVTTIRYRKNLEGFKLELNWDGLVTRIFPYADVQNTDGKTERIYGNKVDSQYIGNYDGEVYARHIQFTEDQGATDTATLNKVASKYFTSMNAGVDKPKVSAEVNIRKLDNQAKFKNFRQLGIFDSFTVFHERYNINLEMTVNKVVYDGLLEQIESIEAGDPKFTFFEEQQNQFTEVMKKVPTKQYSSVFTDYVTKIISGNDGGNVIWHPKERPTDLFFVNGTTLEDSKQVLRINKSGIGFSSNGWKGPFNTAWTLDGTFVADFIKSGTLNADLIKAGVLSGIKIRSVHHDFIIELDQGKIRFIKRNGSSENEMFAFAPTYTGGQLQGINAIQNHGYSFALSSKGNNGALLNVLEIPKDSTAENRKLNLYGEVKVDGNFYVNGVKIDKNGGNSGGGGGWNGQYPPEITSDRDKRYWQIWAMAVGAGFSKQAAAALLGNAQGESDANPTADEGGGRPGFGYGVWQWTDSSGASSGRVYMINLMTRAGVTDNPDTITAQFKLLMWHAPNGQWIAKSSYPYSWTQFMTLTDINTATQAFVANFERPLNGHTERSTWAQEWYNKFVNLEIPSGGGGYIAPISSPITVTSEMGWRTSPITGAQEFHNAVDLVNGNPTTPILASGDGQVVQAGSNYYDWYGNYTVIKHADGLYTGYAHQSRIDVSVGQNVKKGQQIGLMGATGPVTGPHLHFQFMDQYWPSSSAHFKNPRDYIKF